MECASIQLEIFEIRVFFCCFFYDPQPTGGEHIDFGVGPFRVGVGVGIGVRLYIVCTISCEYYENMPIQIYRKFHLKKTDNFQKKNSDSFLISAQNIDCGYSLELPQ